MSTPDRSLGQRAQDLRPRGRTEPPRSRGARRALALALGASLVACGDGPRTTEVEEAPDLQVSGFAAPADALHDADIGGQVALQVRNGGTADVPPGSGVQVGIYVSDDAVITPEDRLVEGGRQALPSGGIAVGQAVPISFPGARVSSTFPDDAPPTGSVYIGVLLDDGGVLEELDESNNSQAARIDLVVPTLDLQVSALSGPDEVWHDEPFGSALTLEVSNTGTLDVAPGVTARIGLYLSGDEQIDPTDRLLEAGEASLPAAGIPAGGSVLIDVDAAARVSTLFPDASPPTGPAFLGALVDVLGEVDETDESNNTAAFPVAVHPSGPDLEIVVLSGPDTVLLDEPFGDEVRLEVRNAGNRAVEAGTSITAWFYLSTDPDITGDDALLQGGQPLSAPGLAPGESIEISLGPGKTVQSAYGLGRPRLGPLHLGVIVDPADGVAELDEANNTAAVPLHVLPSGPDLEVVALSAPDEVVLDEAFGDAVTLEIRNAGTRDIEPGTQASIGFYISSDEEITTSDRLLRGGREWVPADGLAAGASVVVPLASVASVSSTFPDGSPPLGDAYLGVLLDESGAVAELQETNNTAARPIRIVPRGVDLEVTVLTTPERAVVDQEIGLQWYAEVRNAGSVDIEPGTSVPIGFYISTDEEITTADRLLQGGRENLSATGLAAGASIVFRIGSARVGSTFPDASPPLGAVYIGVLVDEFDGVEELDETNNTAARPITVLVEGLDISVRTFTAPDVAVLDDPIGAQVFLEVINTGTVDIAPGTAVAVGFYTSTDPEITRSDVLLRGGREGLPTTGLASGERAVVELFSGASIWSQNRVPGRYYIGALIDEFNVLAEVDETNNWASEPIEVLGNVP